MSAAAGRAPESIPIEHDTYERVIRIITFGAPPAALAIAGWASWGAMLRWHDLVVLAITYTLTGLGITVGYHRLFTHRSFKAGRGVRALLAVLGSMAVEGPVIDWVATHRKHHRFSDQPGDPHSPHLDPAPGWRGTLRGLGHAHIGWVFRGKDRANPARYAKDLLADRDLRFISRTFPLWVLAGLALPFGLGVALTGTIAGGLGGLLWGGAARVLLLHHATFSINSLCHVFGLRTAQLARPRLVAPSRSAREAVWLAMQVARWRHPRDVVGVCSPSREDVMSRSHPAQTGPATRRGRSCRTAGSVRCTEALAQRCALRLVGKIATGGVAERVEDRSGRDGAPAGPSAEAPQGLGRAARSLERHGDPPLQAEHLTRAARGTGHRRIVDDEMRAALAQRRPRCSAGLGRRRRVAQPGGESGVAGDLTGHAPQHAAVHEVDA